MPGSFVRAGKRAITRDFSCKVGRRMMDRLEEIILREDQIS